MKVTVSAPASVTHAALRKGVPVKVTCAPACHARVTLTGRIGIVDEDFVDVADGATATEKVKATAAQARALKKGSKLTVTVLATGTDGGRGMAQRSIRLR